MINRFFERLMQGSPGMLRLFQVLVAVFGLGMIGFTLGIMLNTMEKSGPHAETASQGYPALDMDNNGASPPLALINNLPGKNAPRSPTGVGNPPLISLPGYGQPKPLPTPRKIHTPNEPPEVAGRPGRSGDPTGRGEIRGRLAIVIDDIGHNDHSPRDFLSLGVPITFSVIPGLEFSQTAARYIRSKGGEFMIHLPMQPLGYPRDNPGPNPLLLRLSPKETLNRLNHYLETLPGAVGASNHMGSAYTRNEGRMKLVQSLLHENRMFFLDSRTTSGTVPGRIARDNGYRFLSRDVFLDHEISTRAIRRYLDQAIQRAKRNGRAIAIGHPHPETLSVLRRQLARAQREGLELVTVTDLLRR